jgi:hypothetical protein
MSDQPVLGITRSAKGKVKKMLPPDVGFGAGASFFFPLKRDGISFDSLSF